MVSTRKQTAMVATTMTTRPATPDRWRAALQRALDEGIELRQLAGSDQWIATSGSRPGLAFLTDGLRCGCEAATLGGDPICKHRALFWHRHGLLVLPVPEPPPAPPAGKVIDLIERMAQRAGDEPADVFVDVV